MQRSVPFAPKQGQYVTKDIFNGDANETGWEMISDRVMGGRSNGQLRREQVQGRQAMRLTGRVSLENNGGFLQMALDLCANEALFDASPFCGIELDVLGNDETYNCHLRTTAIERPWQSYRQSFVAAGYWSTIRLHFDGFEAHRVDVPFDPSQLRRIGIVAIGRAFDPDIAVSGARYF